MCRNKNWFTHRMITPFASAEGHGPKEVFHNKFWILKSFEKFFRALEVNPSCLVRCTFWCFKLDFGENPLKTWKNRFLRTSRWWKIVWCGFRSRHALCWKALVLCYPTKTYLIIVWYVQRIIIAHFSKVDFSKISKFFNFWLKISKMASWDLQTQKIATSALLML